MVEINRIYNESNILTMNRIPDNFLDGLIFSSPYNITTKRKDCYYDNGYSDEDNLTQDDFLKIRTKEFILYDRILKEGGVICYNLSYHNENPMLPILLMNKIHNDTNFTLADMITWKKSNSIPFQTSPTKLSRICELIYILVKKNRLHDFKTNKKVSKINEKTGQKFYKNYTNFIEASNNDGLKTKLKATYSTELVEKLIDIYFPENSIIYDPFMGIGTTAKGCINKNCVYIGSEKNKEFFDQSLLNIKNCSKK